MPADRRIDNRGVRRGLDRAATAVDEGVAGELTRGGDQLRLVDQRQVDRHGDGADKLPELLAEAKKRKLTEEEARILADALRAHEPWLEWAGKREMPGFTVDPVALHIH